MEDPYVYNYKTLLKKILTNGEIPHVHEKKDKVSYKYILFIK